MLFDALKSFLRSRQVDERNILSKTTVTSVKDMQASCDATGYSNSNVASSPSCLVLSTNYAHYHNTRATLSLMYPLRCTYEKRRAFPDSYYLAFWFPSKPTANYNHHLSPLQPISLSVVPCLCCSYQPCRHYIEFFSFFLECHK